MKAQPAGLPNGPLGCVSGRGELVGAWLVGDCASGAPSLATSPLALSPGVALPTVALADETGVGWPSSSMKTRVGLGAGTGADPVIAGCDVVA